MTSSDRIRAAPDLDPWAGPAPAYVGTAGWSLSGPGAAAFPPGASHLARYAAVLNAVEINSSFHRPHRRSTYERWADVVPDRFRFAVKVPKAITHEARLADCDAALDRFIDEVGGLGPKLGALLVQLPASLPFDDRVGAGFFDALRQRTVAPVACEPRHKTWFTPEAGECLAEWQVARVAADPAPVPDAEAGGGWPGLIYRRLHGSPRIYYSDYPAPVLEAVAQAIGSAVVPSWCIFDNTAAAHALGNALVVSRQVTRERDRSADASGSHRPA